MPHPLQLVGICAVQAVVVRFVLFKKSVHIFMYVSLSE